MALIPDHLTAELQVSVSSSLHAQGQLAHEAVNADLQGRAAAPSSEGGPAEAALLHQPAEAAATVLPSQQQRNAEPQQPLRPRASRGQPNTKAPAGPSAYLCLLCWALMARSIVLSMRPCQLEGPLLGWSVTAG